MLQAPYPYLGKRQFVHKMFLRNFGALSHPTPPPNSEVMDFLLNFYIRRPSNRIANTLRKLRTNSPKIANKQNPKHLLRAFLINNLEGCARGTTRYFFHSFPSCGASVVQSCRSPKQTGAPDYLSRFAGTRASNRAHRDI